MKIVAQNRRAKFDYEVLETVEAGIMLTGQEVKSCRMGHVSLPGSYVSFLHGAPILKGAKISPYVHASGLEDYDPGRDRPLLNKKKEGQRLEAMSSEKGNTIIPLELRAGRFVKVLLGIGRGRKRIDKRQRIRQREVERGLRRGEEY